MRYITDYEHIYFDRYTLSDEIKREEAIYLMEKSLSEADVEFKRREDVFIIAGEKLKEGTSMAKIVKIMKREFFILIDEEKAVKMPLEDSIEKFVAKMYLYEDLTTVSIMEKFQMSRKKTDKYFTDKYGKTAKEYIRDLRVEKAIDMVRSGINMSTVAYCVGFGSVKTMTRAFKSSCNATPGQFRSLDRKIIE